MARLDEDDDSDFDADQRRKNLREQLIYEFAFRQRRERKWIWGEDIARWCARKPDSFDHDAAELDRACRVLLTSIVRGDFGGERTKNVRRLDRIGFMILTPEGLQKELERFHPDPASRCRSIVSQCWFRHDSCRHWFEMVGRTPPPWLTVNVDESLPWKSDDELVQQMHRFVSNGMSARAAAAKVAPQARPGNSEQATIDRLRRWYRAKYVVSRK